MMCQKIYLTIDQSNSIIKDFIFQVSNKERILLKKNEKLDNIVITPTTKGVNDIPITLSEIVEQKYLTQEQLDIVTSKALELFKYGQNVVDKAGLILVDTKYEFGKTKSGEILLIDEIHTPS